MNASISELTSAIASGDTGAFETLFRAWFDRMYGEARRATGRDESFCLDVVQDAMMRVIKSMKPMHNEAQLRHWLFVVVRTCAYDRLRRESRRRRREQESLNRADARGGSEPVIEDRLEWLEHELQSMTEPEARLLTMRYRMGWTLQRIGRALGLTTGAVDGRLSRLVASLRRRAKESYDE